MKKIFFLLAFLFLGGLAFSQVGINTTVPRGSLDVNSSTQGLIPPRVSLTSTAVAAPVVNPQGGAIVSGTIVYNTVTAGTAPDDVIPGFYYWNGTRWLLMSSQTTSAAATSSDWTLLGNNSTNPATNFIGTTNAVDFVTRTNNTEKVRVTSAGNVGIGTSAPTSTLDVNGALRVRSIPTTTSPTGLLTADTNGNVSSFNNYLPTDVDGVVATAPVDYSVTVATTVNNINLGLSTSVTIPANKSCIIMITYSVPVGLTTIGLTNEAIGYYGIRFLKNGTEAESGSRKSSIISNHESGFSSVCMTTITNTYVEKFTTGATPVTNTYTLNGYLEYLSNFPLVFRFNMWSNSPPNYNWGRATITKQVYIL